MTSYIPHLILTLTDQVTQSAMDETLTEAYRLAFDWANRMGKEGKRVYDLFLQKPNYAVNPFDTYFHLWCKIECSKEDRIIWEENRKMIFNISLENTNAPKERIKSESHLSEHKNRSTGWEATETSRSHCTI